MISSSYLNSNNDSPFISGGGGGGGGGSGRLSLIMAAVAAPSTPAVVFTALAGLALVAVIFYGASRGRLKSPWSRRRRKHALSSQQWKSLFTQDGKLRDGGIKFLKRVRSGGVDPSIRAEVWPFLLGVYDLDSTKEERDVIRTRNRKEYEKLRRRCRQLLKQSNESFKLNEIGEISYEGDGESLIQASGSPSSEDATSARQSLSSEERSPDVEYSDDPSSALLEGDDVNNVDAASDTDSTDSDSSDGPEVIQTSPSNEFQEENPSKTASTEISSPSRMKGPSKLPNNEDFATWQRIIRLDAVRANGEWIPFSPCQAVIPESRAIRSAEAVGLKEYGHLEPNRIFHAARLVAILEAYALYDPEIGYCQGMSDLLSPIVSVISEDHEAFWCFVGFMKKARQNFRLDEVGIRRQLDIVAKIIKFKDSHLFRHLEKLQADDCFFVYRMVVVLFRRELTFEQTLCLWEVMWADQAAIRAGIGKSAWSRIRQRAPPTDDLLLYAIAASVLQRRKLIIEKYSSMDEIIKECNGMAGHLDIWKLLDDAHTLVVNLHDKMKLETSFR
ncbi:Rab GTPase-activating protein 22 [Stylosanthes scabra]|uniref:Rab GTPase-activating protein 22 n=1 Tax=Stylosanthes scabra TaxID=79078 RepID=A0ABU6QIQ7_9FABA|nr:Rab GTPase-activating protein 22 [Stylosanthes scabra]